MDVYHPGWMLWPAGKSCDRTRWCSALNIDSLSVNSNTGQNNNSACLNTAGIEPVNFAFITKDGVPPGPPSPLLQNGSTFTPFGNADILFYHPGDLLRVALPNTPAGLKIPIADLTTRETVSPTGKAPTRVP